MDFSPAVVAIGNVSADNVNTVTHAWGADMRMEVLTGRLFLSAIRYVVADALNDEHAVGVH